MNEEKKPQVHVYESQHPSWIFRVLCTCGNTTTVYPIHESPCLVCGRMWTLVVTARAVQPNPKGTLTPVDATASLDGGR